MGNGIAQVAAQSGLGVVMSDIADSFVQKGLTAISKNLTRMVEKGKIPSQKKDEILGRIKGTVQVKDMAETDFVVEAAIENESLKLNIFRELIKFAERRSSFRVTPPPSPSPRLPRRLKGPHRSSACTS